jgi:hypothetical protein
MRLGSGDWLRGLRVLVGECRTEIVFLHLNDTLVELPQDAGPEKHTHQPAFDLVIGVPHELRPVWCAASNHRGDAARRVEV